MQRTLNRELKELEVVGREAIARGGERRPGGDPPIKTDTAVAGAAMPPRRPASVRPSNRHQFATV
jgi:hypothetical protein